jgi:hypothetical protein
MSEHIQSTLRAMAINYGKRGHSWDHLDGEACVKAATRLDELEAELSALKAQQAEQKPVVSDDCPFCGENETVAVEHWSPFYGKNVESMECKCCGAMGPFGSDDPASLWRKRTAPQPAPAQDVAGLVEALEEARHRLVECNRRNSDPDECIWVMAIDAALAANDKQSGGEV